MSQSHLDEVLGAPREDLIIDDGSSVLLDAQNKRFARARQAVRIESYGDLQALDLVPRWLDEKAAREAIALDDEDALALARRHVGAKDADAGCACDDGGLDTTPKLTYRRAVRHAYVGVRKSQHFQLARRMSESSRTHYQFDDLHPAVVHGWLSRLNWNGVIEATIWLWKDVVIGKNATLTLGAADHYLGCGDLRIHVGGKLVIAGSGAKIRCATAEGNLP